jgi:polysaccharide pyruvyl transferase WcaK-like protein
MFSVPSGEEFQYELLWSKKYGVEIIEDYSIKDIILPFGIYHSKLNRAKSWLNKLSEVDIVIDMSAISYVGYPIGNSISVLLSPRFRYFLTALFCRKPFLAWTQSYGPLSPKIVQFIAKLDLSRQPIIFCRGDDCLDEVKNILPTKKIFSFPDVATVLDYDSKWGIDYVKSLIPDIDFGKLITVSPSSVIFNKTKTPDGESRHIKDMVSVCNYIINIGYFILLVPHTFRPNRHKPEICDYAVSQLILNQINDLSKVAIVSEDLSPIELKSIISTAYIHIGARYHSVVAALSSGVPTISLSWHPKYKDIMRMYNCENYVYDVVNNSNLNNLFAIFDEVSKHKYNINKKLIDAQRKVEVKVEENTQLFVTIIKGIL